MFVEKTEKFIGHVCLNVLTIWRVEPGDVQRVVVVRCRFNENFFAGGYVADPLADVFWMLFNDGWILCGCR